MQQELANQLNTVFGSRFSQNPAILDQHGHGESHHKTAPPSAVIYVKTEEEVSNTMKLCQQYQCPVTAFGAGTSIEGQVQALKGGLCLDFSQMNRILEVNREDFDCLVEPGVTREQLNHYLRDQGLFFPVDPGANATIGGMIATNASGTTTIRYGNMKNNLLGLEAIMASGSKISTGTRARKSSAGYSLTELLVGSEGTLALVTAARLRLHGIPESIVSARAEFTSVHDATRAVTDILLYGLSPARIELLDSFAIKAINTYCKTSYPEQPALFLEFHGHAEAALQQAKLGREICAQHQCNNYHFASGEAERQSMWHARHNAYYAALAQVPDGKGWVTDVAVPVSSLADCIHQTRDDLESEGLDIPIVGHVGDGNFHLLFSIPVDDDRLLEKAGQVNQRLVQRAHTMGGTCTGEHGIGFGKKNYLVQEKGESTVEAMKTIKQALDPDNLLNPGKIF